MPSQTIARCSAHATTIVGNVHDNASFKYYSYHKLSRAIISVSNYLFNEPYTLHKWLMRVLLKVSCYEVNADKPNRGLEIEVFLN